MTAGRPGKRSASDAERTRGAIIEAALAAFAEQGFDKASVRDIAREAGVSHGILRHHFGSKMALWTQVMDQVFDHFANYMVPLFSSVNKSASEEPPLSAAESFRKVVCGFVDISLQNPEYTRLFVLETKGEGERAEYCQKRFAALHEAIDGLFSQAKEEIPALANHSNDSFFYSLMSLTYFHLVFPAMGASIEFPVAGGFSTKRDMIVGVLMPDFVSV